MQLLLGEQEGRVPVAVGGLPSGVIAVTVPVRRQGEARLPRDRRRLLKIGEVDLISAGLPGTFDPPSSATRRELIFALEVGRRDWSTVVSVFGVDRAWGLAVDLVRSGGVVLRCGTDENLDLGDPTSWRRSYAWSSHALDTLNDLRGLPDPDALREELLDLMAPVVELQREHALLAVCPRGAPLRVPVGTATGTQAWSVYERAVRAAAVWWPYQSSGAEPLTAKGLASKAFRDSKDWRPERELAFANLIGTSFDLAVTQADTDVRVRGPLMWQVGRVAADAMVAEPWISVPAKGLHAAGIIECAAQGILLIENSDTFELVCKLSEVTEQWLCVWGKGHTSHGVVALLRHLAPRPVLAWCDLDADGIGIIDVLARKLGRAVHPVGMDLDMWSTHPHRKQKPKDIARDKVLAAKLVSRGPEALRPLAAEIAEHGGSCEQEAIQDQVLPGLAAMLASYLQARAARQVGRE